MIAGRYSLDREVGRGGMGSVWLAQDEALGRPVALKRIGLLPHTSSTDLARAEREARLAARLLHPHVVSVFDYVTDDDGHWLVMEYVDGLDLDRFVRDQGPLTPDEAGQLLGQVADALTAAHAADIVHRDVKPSNIMLDRNLRAKLTDFGIARISADPSLTQTGMFLGTPSYLAPEVAAGRRGEEAADVWSLGATLFFALSGHPPYDATGGALATLHRIGQEEPPRLDRAGWLAPLLDATMVRDPAARWSMAEVGDFLARGPQRPAEPAPRERTGLLAFAGSSATAPARERSDESRRRRTRLVALVAAAVVAVLVLTPLLANVLANVFSGDDPGSRSAGAPSSARSSTTPRSTSSSSPTPSPTQTPSRKPTAAGMSAFIRDYVRTVADDPDQAWRMLTPKFQGESGGLARYRAFWGPATNGRVLSVDSDPRTLSVSYQVRFDDFDNGPGPTVLDLTYRGGRYRINGERSQGFVPAG